MKEFWKYRAKIMLLALATSSAGLIATSPFAQAASVSCPWMDATQPPAVRAQEMLNAMTQQEKLSWLDEQNQYALATDPALCLPNPFIKYTDGPTGVQGNGTGVTAFPAPMGLTATWDLLLNRQKGQAHGAEAFGKGVNVILGPNVNGGRVPFDGRNYEQKGEDPFLAGQAAAAEINGIQLDNPDTPVEAVLKHFVLNDQELDRQTSSSNIDDRTLHEIYLTPFEMAVKQAAPGGIMCAYDQVDGIYSCENGNTETEILKTQVGFQGWIVSDFGAVHSTVPSLLGGLDQELNRPIYYSLTNLQNAITSGQASQTQVESSVLRIITALFRLGLVDHQQLPSNNSAVVSTPAHVAIARQISEEGTVLLQNTGGILPVSSNVHTIAVIGPTASTATSGVSASSVCSVVITCSALVTPLQGIQARAAQAGQTVVFDNGGNLSSAAATAAGADLAIVFGYYLEGEGADRTTLSLDGSGDNLISTVAAANPNTVVVLTTGGPALMPWVNSVKGIIEAWYPGQEAGNALAALLWGDVNFSGKLPQSFPRSQSDLPTQTSAQYPGVFSNGSTTRPSNTAIRQVEYFEGLLTGYRWYDSQAITPLFPFGFGLSYTQFRYSGLRLQPGGTDSYGQPVTNAVFNVTNTGTRAGNEIAQVYVGEVNPSVTRPVKELKGFQRVYLSAGQTKQVVVPLGGRAFAYYNSNTAAWSVDNATFNILVGASSRDIRLSATTTRTAATLPGY